MLAGQDPREGLTELFCTACDSAFNYINNLNIYYFLIR